MESVFDEHKDNLLLTESLLIWQWTSVDKWSCCEYHTSYCGRWATDRNDKADNYTYKLTKFYKGDGIQNSISST